MFFLNPTSIRWSAPLLFFLALTAKAASLPDLPPCETHVGVSAPAWSIGIVEPYAAPDVIQYATQLASQNPGVAICSEPWRAVLPRFLPWAGQLERGYGFGIALLAFLASVGLLTRFVPAERWRRVTLTGVLAVGGLTWVLAVSAMGLFHWLGGQRLAYGTVVSVRPAQQKIDHWWDVSGAREFEARLHTLGLPSKFTESTLPAPGVRVAVAGQYVVFHRLNLREGPGVDAPRIATLPVGAFVSFEGRTQGDWWEVKTAEGMIGWVSSIWLRRIEETRPPGSIGKNTSPAS